MDSKIVNAITVDVEDYFQVAAFNDAIDRKDWDNIPTRVESNTQRLLDLFDEAGVKATFFILGWVAERYPQLVSEINNRGHEVGSHGFSHQLIYDQDRELFRRETVRSKELLEDITGSPIRGYRAASYSITKRSIWALDVIVEAGFDYDSSVVPVHHDLYGIPGAKPMPHKLRTEQGRIIVEFPPSTWNLFGAQIPVGGGGYFRLFPYTLTELFLKKINKIRSEPFIFYLHPWEIDPEQPRVRASLRSRFRHYLNLRKTELRLTRLLRNFRFNTVQSVLKDLELLA